MERLFAIEEACETLGISDATLRRIMRRKEIQYQIIGKRPKFTMTDIQDYLERNKVHVAPPQVRPYNVPPRAQTVGRPSRSNPIDTGYYPGMKVV